MTAKFILVLMALNLVGCSDNRVEDYIGGYAKPILVDVNNEVDLDNKHYQKGQEYKDTQEAVSAKKSILHRDESIKGLTSASMTLDGEVECVIVHQTNVKSYVIDHEMAHCFTLLLRTKLLAVAPELTEDFEKGTFTAMRIQEGFAETLTAYILHEIDGDFTYMNYREIKLNGSSHGDEMRPYHMAAELFGPLKIYIKNKKKSVDDRKADVEDFIAGFYLNTNYNPNWRIKNKK